MDKEDKIKIENLTNEKNYLDKKIKKAKKQLAIMDFLTDKFLHWFCHKIFYGCQQ